MSTKSKVITAKPASSNWKALKQALSPVITKSSTGANGTSLKRKRTLTSASTESNDKKIKFISLKGKERQDDDYDEDQEDGSNGGGGVERSGKSGKGKIDVAGILAGGTGRWQAEAGQYLAIDCEMVGVGPEGSESTLARVSIVNFHGAVVLDKFVRPREKVTDYRTWVSGVREEDLRSAPSFVEVQKEVAAIIKDRILIGHAISNDTDVLLLSHPRTLTRDTSKYAPLQGLAKTKRPGLKTLAKLVLGVDIQSGEHSSVDDARATMAIYRSQKSAWEDSLRNHTKPSLLTGTTTALSELDLTNVSLVGVGKSNNPDKKKKALGLAATLRFARNEAEEEVARLGKLGEEEMDERGRKKFRREREDDIVLGFDYEVKKVVVRDLELEKQEKKEKREKEEEAKKLKKEGLGKKVRKVVGRAFKGDREKRPRKSAEGWWAEDE